jgi:hypothetical protein
MKWYIAWAGDNELTGGQHPKSIAGQKYDVGRVACGAGDPRIVDEFDRVSVTRVLSQTCVCIVHQSVLVEHHVFKDGPEAQRRKNVRLIFG